MTTTTEASTEPDYFKRACAAHFAYAYITSMLDRDPSAPAMRRGLRDVLAEFRSAGIGEGQ